MGNPVLVEALRGRLVESRHCGAVAVVDADGRRVLAVGEIERPVYPRSAIKALQALPLIESGAADHFALADEELALACASHSGEPGHIATATEMLQAPGSMLRRPEMRRALADKPSRGAGAGANRGVCRRAA